MSSSVCYVVYKHVSVRKCVRIVDWYMT